MFNLGSNQILLLSCLVLLVGTGTYLTYFRQQETLSTLEQEIEAKREEIDKIETLKNNLSEADAKFQQVRQRWENRYKTVPETMASPEVIEYLTTLTQTGFKTFNVASADAGGRDGYSVYAFNAEGKAFFTSLYEFVWTVENNRPFYRIRDLQLNYLEERSTNEETGRTMMDVLVSFQMEVEAIYGILGGDAPARSSEGGERESLPVAQTTPTPPLPADVGPNPSPDVNPFYPLVFEQVPPNQHGRLNIESAQLISIVGGQAVFETEDEIQRVEEGDRVYLGRITEVSAANGRVVARLNRGGIIETVERTLDRQSPLERLGGSENEDTE